MPTTGAAVFEWQDCIEVETMNKIQTKGGYKTQRKRRTRAVALAQIAASKISHSKSSKHSQLQFLTAQTVYKT
jgi:hypothetical protein